MDMQELANKCTDNGGVLAVTLGDLRDLIGAGRLGRGVLATIATELAGHGLGYFPLRTLSGANDTPRQSQVLRIYRKGSSSTARVIEAVITPSDPGDEYLRGLSGDDAQAVLDRIRALVALDQ